MGGTNPPVYTLCKTSGRQLTLYSEYNDGYLQGYMDPSEQGFLWGWQNGNTLNLMWSPWTFRNDPPWFFEGAYNDVHGNTFLAATYQGAAHAQVKDVNGAPVAFTMSRTINVP